MALYGVGLDVEVKRIHLNMKLSLSKRGGSGIACLRDLFRGYDDGSGGIGCKDF